MSRLDQIQSKLAYTEKQFQLLGNALFDSKRKRKEPEFICHTVADILSSSRECYDYCAKDILEEIIIPSTQNTGLISSFNNGKIRFYFPFYRSELENTKNPSSELVTIFPDLHNHLLHIADSISTGAVIPNTLFNYADIEQLKNLVNEKKHDSLIAIESNQDQEILIEKSGVKMIIPIKEQKGWNRFKVSPGSNISRVQEFRLKTIDKEILSFCLFARKATGIVLDEIYEKFLSARI